MCQEKNDEEDLTALKVPLTHRYNACFRQRGGRLTEATTNKTYDTTINRNNLS